MFFYQRVAVVAFIGAVLFHPGKSEGVVLGGLTPGDFVSPTVETFNPPVGCCSPVLLFDYGNGMVYESIAGGGDLVKFIGGYGMGFEPSLSFGSGGPGDGYFGTFNTPASFEFMFIGGTKQFGFRGAESRVVDVGSSADQRNGVLDLEFYDLSDNLLLATSVVTAGVFAWDQFHGFESTDEFIAGVVFRNVGHMVLDDVHFSAQGRRPVPEPASLGLMAAGLVGLALVGWRRRRP